MLKSKTIRYICICLIVLFPVCSFAQDSSHIRISLLTCSPGEELYSTFGHSAIRITDSSSVTDIVFNYGTFDFDDPNFYTKFIQGKLLYYVSAEYFEEFKNMYQSTNRGITEQLLNLSPAEKINITHALYNNIKEENKFYKYDFFLDNCTTRLRDIIIHYKSNIPPFKPVVPEGTKFRQAIHEYLDKNGKAWSKLGIDILLGLPTDAVMTTAQSQFLPDNLMHTLDKNNDHNNLVISTTNLYPVNNEKNSQMIFTPFVVFTGIFLLILLLGFSSAQWAKTLVHGLDGLLFFVTGALGFVLIFMMTGTDHAMCRNNLNLLWALPSNALLAFFVSGNKNWTKYCFGITAVILILFLLSWYFLPQNLNEALIPIILILIVRSVQKLKISF